MNPFEQVFSRVTADPLSSASAALTDFVLAFVDERDFDLSRIDQLDESDQKLSLEIFNFCFDVGLCEEERARWLASFSALFCSKSIH